MDDDDLAPFKLTKQAKAKLKEHVGEYASMNARVKSIKMKQVELEETAWEDCGVKPDVLRQLAKESAWDDTKRAKNRHKQQSLQVCREALGILADLPLGQAELSRVEAEKAQSKKAPAGKKKNAREGVSAAADRAEKTSLAGAKEGPAKVVTLRDLEKMQDGEEADPEAGEAETVESDWGNDEAA